MDNFKQDHMDNWLEILYGPFPKYFIRAKVRIIKDAYEAVEEDYSPTCIAYFRGIAYSEVPTPISSNPPRLDLVDTYKDRMESLFQEKVELEIEKTVIKGYLSRILNLSICPRDATALLPPSIREHLSSWKPLPDTNLIEDLPELTRIEFQSRNRQFSDQVSERILTNLLLNHK